MELVAVSLYVCFVCVRECLSENGCVCERKKVRVNMSVCVCVCARVSLSV